MTDKGGGPRKTNSSSRRRPTGDVLGVSVDPKPGNPRPVTIEVEGHRCRYELAWAVIEGQPAVTDLRIVPQDGEPVTAADLRVNLDRIAAAAASSDTEHSREVWRGVRQALEAATGLPRESFEWIESYRPTAASIDRWAELGGIPRSKRSRGRPKLPDEHYEAVAALVLKLKATETRSLYRDFAERWPGEPPASTIRDWIAGAKTRDLLAKDALRSTPEPRTAPTKTEETDR